jgi:cell division protein ZapE
MKIFSYKDSFLKFCEDNKFEKNTNQIEVVKLLEKFAQPNKNFFNLFLKKKDNLCFYLYGGVGFGKTMILNHFYNFLDIPKERFHFNEFMISFHDFRHQNKKHSITEFVYKFKKKKLIYLDELQVTNIVDAMILGKLFETIFAENIKVLISSNIKIENLYKGGLQREQFLPFISIIQKNSVQKELTINEDYRKSGSKKLQRAFSPINETNKFKINQLFRALTKNKVQQRISLKIKGRNFLIPNFYDGIVKFDFKELCNTYLGAEDYIEIANKCKFVVIENIPIFNNENANQQQRFITLIDIFYEKKIDLMVSMENSINNIGSSNRLAASFKRTLSRLFELTAPSDQIL